MTVSEPGSVVPAIDNALVVTRRGVEHATVVIREGRVAAVRQVPCREPDAWNVGGAYLLPGVVDLHCDVLEQLTLNHRGVSLAPNIALPFAERTLAAAGITTAYHAIAFMDASIRSARHACELAGLVSGAPSRLARHGLHIRCEAAQASAVSLALDCIKRLRPQIVSVMDHGSDHGQFSGREDYAAFLRGARALEDCDIEATLGALPGDVRVAEEQLAAACGETSAILACHDDGARDDLERHVALGSRISEFPLSLQIAREARARGLAVCVGAPNALRGSSTGGHLSAREAVAEDLVDALCSDYACASMLPAAWTLAREGIVSLHDAVALVTTGPARLMGVDAKVEFSEGDPGDLILVRESRGVPLVLATLREGRIATTFGLGCLDR